MFDKEDYFLAETKGHWSVIQRSYCTMRSTKTVYFFGAGKADGRENMKNLLGGKGANLAEMTNLGIPVPAGFTITTEVCTHYYLNKRKYPKGVEEEVTKALRKVEKIMGPKFGDP